jgi:hypothetical protein
MRLEQAQALAVGQQVTVWSGRRGHSSYYSLPVSFLGLEKVENLWVARVRHPLWLEGKSLIYPIRQLETR